MYYALVDGKRTKPSKTGLRGICPECGAELISKVGEIVVPHWAHTSADHELACWASEPKTQWHIDWQNRWPESEQEVLISHGNAKHIADIATTHDGMRKVIEFQHSSITAEEIRKREEFYGRMFWVFDCRAEYGNGSLAIDYEFAKRGTCNVIWDSPKRTIRSCEKQLYLQITDTILLFPIFDTYKHSPMQMEGKRIVNFPRTRFTAWIFTADDIAAENGGRFNGKRYFLNELAERGHVGR